MLLSDAAIVMLPARHAEGRSQAQALARAQAEDPACAGLCAHAVHVPRQVRDLLTTEHEQQLKRRGQPGPASSLSRDAITVDAIVSTIGFPLVGGPAGAMEGGRQADVAKAILTAKNVPYVVAAPLLIQARLYSR